MNDTATVPADLYRLRRRKPLLHLHPRQRPTTPGPRARRCATT